MSHDAPPAPILSIEHLSILLPDGQKLLDRASLNVAEGEFLLLVGPSGSGKSTLLKLIAGLMEGSSLRVEGTLRVGRAGAQSAASGGQGRVTVGMVFQDLALFDELSPEENVQFAIDHRKIKDHRLEAGGTQHGLEARATSRRQDAGATRDEARRRLHELGVPPGRRLVQLSGGERQRVAVARTMAMEPAILLVDEPTTGLDPIRARAVADLIARTHRESGRTVIIVTHDFAPFLPHRPRLVLLDNSTGAGTLRDVDEPSLLAWFANAETQNAETRNRGNAEANVETSKRRNVETQRGSTEIRRTPSPWAKLLPLIEEPGGAMVTLAESFVTPAQGWRLGRWKLRYLWHYLRMMLIGSTAVYVAAGGAMLGFVSVFFGLSQMPYKQVTLPLLREEFLAATGYSAYRVLVPLLIALLMAGKCGAAAAADVGARRLTKQHEAMRSFGASPRHYLHGNIIIALALAGPLLTLLAFAATSLASMVAFLTAESDATSAVFTRNYFATMWPEWSLLPRGTWWMVIKQLTSGILIGALGYYIGARPKASSTDVSRDVGLTIFWASLAVLALHAGYSFVEF